MPWENPPFDYRGQTDLALQVISQLELAWNGLSPAAQAEIQGLLAQNRAELVRAGGDVDASNVSTGVFQADRQRAVTLNRFLYACENATSVPNDTKALLGSAHKRPGLVIRLSKDDARTIVATMDRSWPPIPASAGSPATSSTKPFPDPLGRARSVIKWLVQNWNALSIESEDIASRAMVDLGLSLENAQDDAEREAAAQVFLGMTQAFVPESENLGVDRSGASTDNSQRILDTLQRHPIVGPALQDASSSARGADLARPSPSAALVAKDIQPADTTVPLHTFVDFPAEVSVFDSKIPLLVQFTIEQLAGSLVNATWEAKFSTPEEVKQVLVVCDADGFKEESGVSTRLIEVYAARNSQPAVFLLTPEKDVEPGPKRIRLDFIYCGVQVLSSSFEVLIKDRPPVQRDKLTEIRPLIEGERQGVSYKVMGASLELIQPVVAAPDLVLRVALSRDERELRFTLDSPSSRFSFRQTPAGRVTLPARKSPREPLESVFLSLNAMAGTSFAKRTAAETEANRKEIYKIGWNLYQDLFPQELKDAWRYVRSVRAGKDTLSLLVISDEPWIPWELVDTSTTDEHGVFVEEGFLCEQFRMSRWVAGRRPSETMTLTSTLLVAPQSDLAWVKQEKVYFDELSKTQPKIEVNPTALQLSAEVEAAFINQKARLYHFACHADFDPNNPDDSYLKLNGPSLRPSDIIGPAQVGIELSKPLVFLNACTSAGAEIGLTGVGGWARRFVDSGVTAFIGSLWEVNDALAAKFAKTFYDQVIINKAPLGEAFHQARQTTKMEDPGNPTWLAYVLYAHPNGKVEINA